MPPVIDKNKCDTCKGKEYQICVEHCITDVFKGSKPGEIPVVSLPEECMYENACVIDCPHQAITLRIPLTMYVPFKQK